MSKPVTIYHFTNMLSLPDILEDGITRGEVPTEEVGVVPKAPNLTMNPDPSGQDCWAIGGQPTDKTKIRFTIVIDQSKLTSFKKIKKQYKIDRTFLKKLAPKNEYLDWHFAFGGVSVEEIQKIEIADRNGNYRELIGDELDNVCAAIVEERRKLNVFMTQGRVALSLKDGYFSCWLVDRKFPELLPAIVS